MILPITSLYASLLVVIILFLAFKVGSTRGKLDISLGDGDNPEMLEAIRRHGNAIENVPITVFLMALMEANEAHAVFLHTLGAVLVLARILHPMGLKADKMNDLLRGLGAGGTVLVMVVSAVYLIWAAVQSLLP